MRNLELYYHVDRHFDQFNNVQHFCVNPLENTVFVFDDGVIYCVSQDENNVDVFNVKEHCIQELNSKVVGMCYNSVLGALCLGTEAGDLLTVMWASRTVQVVGSVPQGLRSLRWAPEEEMLLLVTGEAQVLGMTTDFDPLWEQPLHQTAFGEKEPVTVGWGSKSTQFHGSEGKAAAKAMLASASSSLSPKDDGSVRVSWRGDGELVAIGAPRPDGGARCIRIFSREGVLQATSEAVPGLEMALAWRPSGNLIASTQVLPNKYQVVFFEKNGLRHGEFTLPFAPGEGVVRHLEWNAESEVLSVWYEDNVDGAHLLLCTVSNYHWYVKQSFSFPTKRQLLACAWDPEERLKLHLVYGAVRYSVFEWIWTVNRSSAYAEENRAEVAVIDGNEVLLTAFTEKVVPPPMCAERLQLPCSINQVVFGPATCSESLCAILSDGRLALFEGSERVLSWVRGVRLESELPEGLLNLHHWLWVSEKLLLAVATEGLTSRLVRVDIAEQKEAEDSLKPHVMDIPLEGAVVTISPVGDGSEGDVVVQTTSGDLLLVQLGQPEEPFTQPLSSSEDKLLQVYALPCNNRAPCIVGLSARCRLSVDGREVASNATSLLPLPRNGLLVTTSSHTLLYLQLPVSGQNGQMCTSVSDAVSRRVERGSRLVTATGARVVLQMPRGNLETLTPRALVLQEAAKHLDEGHFAQVFGLFRKQRINLNLLVDHNPALFMKRVEDFVREISDPAWLSILAVELLEEDVTKTAYADSYHTRPRQTDLPWPEGKKRVVVCTRLCEAMNAVVAKSEDRAAMAQKLLLPRLSALAVGCGNLEAALRVASEAGGEAKERGLKHLLTQCDARALYRAALALYDFRLAALVAARSNRDPKEYLPFLNELLHLDEDYRRYRVDAHLNRWPSALAHISCCSDRFDEFLSVMQQHSLHGHALSLFCSDDERYRKVAALYGEYLLKERKLEEATVMLRRAQKRQEALEACRLAGDWQQALVLLTEMQCPSEVRKERLQALSAVLLQQRRFQEAAHILFRHCAYADEAVSALCQGRLWAEAELVAAEAQRVDLLEQVKQAVVEHCELLLTEVCGHKHTYETHLDRLRIVRAEKLHQPEERETEVGAESDLYSDTSSTSGSGSYGSGRSGSRSGRSTRSGKNRRKQERKLLSLKEGAPHEDLALLRAMHQITTTCFAYRKEVHALCLALLGISRDAEAAALQRSLASALQLMEDSRAEVWPPELTSPNAITSMDERYGPDATVNSIVTGTNKTKVLTHNCELLDPQYRIPPQAQEHINWKLSVLNT